jgi:Mor family transcriptional regulator
VYEGSGYSQEGNLAWRSGQSYPQDLRDRTLNAVDGGMEIQEAAARFGVSGSYIYKALRRQMVVSCD